MYGLERTDEKVRKFLQQVLVMVRGGKRPVVAVPSKLHPRCTVLVQAHGRACRCVELLVSRDPRGLTFSLRLFCFVLSFLGLLPPAHTAVDDSSKYPLARLP